MKGLKDNQIQELVNRLRNKLQPLTPHNCLRELISECITEYLETNNLRIDKENE